MKNRTVLTILAAAFSLAVVSFPSYADPSGNGGSKQPPPKIQVQVGRVTKHADPPPSKSGPSKDNKRNGKS